MSRTRTLALLTACSLALLGAACSGDDGGAASDTTAAATTATATTVAPTTAPAVTAAATTVKPTTTVAPTTAAPKIVAPDALGPYGVGLRTITIESNGRTIPVDVWYPAAPGTTGPPGLYTFLPGIELSSEAAFADVPVATDGGPFPLVIYSHGSGGLRYISASLTELLASHGFVVAAPDHQGNTAADTLLGTPVSFEQNTVNRLTDVSATIDRMLAEGTTAGGPWEGAINADEIGVVGHSAGGATALVTQSGAVTSLGTVPADDRIDALALWAPAAGGLSPDQLAAVDVPVLYIGGTLDDVTPIDPNITVPWTTITETPAFRVDLANAGHQSYTDVCRIQDSFATNPAIPELLVKAVDGYAEDACTDQFMPIERAHQLIDRYTVSFFVSQLAAPGPGPVADAYLDLLTTAGGDDVTVQTR